MTRVASSFNILILIDNTAPMNRTTSDFFPVISYAKSAVRAIVQDNMARSKRGVYLTIAYTNPVGRPTCITCQKPIVPSEINYLQVSPTGSFDETVIEGLVEFNRQRMVMYRDAIDTYFLPRKPDVYVVALFSNFETLSRQFHKFSIGKADGEEWLFRPDENVMLFSTDVEDKTEYLQKEFQSALEQLQVEIVPLQQAYNYFQAPPCMKILSAMPIFTFVLCFASQKVRCTVLHPGKEPSWPFPYEFSTNGASAPVSPAYFCCKADRSVDASKLKCDEYVVNAAAKEPIETGDYLLTLAPQAPAFGLLTVSADAMKLKVLPWNFMKLIDILAKGNNIPSKEDCDAYFGTVPVQYIDKTVQFFSENRWGFSAEAAERRQTKSTGQKKQEREDMFKRQDFHAQDMPIFIDPTKMRTETLEDLMSQITLAKCQYRMRKTRTSIRINNDTIADDRFMILEEVKAKPQSYMRVFERSRSPVTGDMVRNFLAEKPAPAEKSQRAVIRPMQMETEAIPIDESGRDDITMLEDLVVLMRDKDTKEIERRIQEIQNNTELCSFVRSFLLKAMQRFRLERCLPDDFVSMLTGVRS